MLIDFKDLVENFSDAQIKEIIFQAQQKYADVQTLVYGLDFTLDFRLARLLKSLESNRFKIEAQPLEKMAKEYTQGFSGEVVHLSSAGAKIRQNSGSDPGPKSAIFQSRHFQRRQANGLDDISPAAFRAALRRVKRLSGILQYPVHEKQN